jgi:VCBS repeat-containing protein
MQRIWREMRDRGRFLSSREWALGTRACRPRRLVLEPLETRTLLDGAGIVGGRLFDDLDRSGGRDPGEPPLVDWTVELQRVGSTNVPEVTFANPSPDDWSQFGRFVASAGANVLVGSHYDDVSGYADAGAAYLFDGTTGELLQTLVSPIPTVGDKFGRAVAGIGDDLLVGAPLDDTANRDAGAVYLFDAATGTLLQRFLSPTAGANDQFGRAVAAVGDRVLIGARRDDTAGQDAGAVYLFDRDSGALLQTYVSPTPTENAQFGYSVANMGENVLVGARYDNTGADGLGAVYLFDGSTGNLLQSFPNPVQRGSGRPSGFGRAVAAAGNHVVVGARWDDMAEEGAGSAFVFDGATGELLHVLNSPTPAAGEEFGFVVAALGDDILVGARWDNREESARNANGGAVYLFDGATGELLQTIANPAPTAWDAFGVSVATLGDQVLVGSQFGNVAYTFQALPEVSTTSTDGQGNYRFTQVEAGTYRVVQQLADGYVPTYPGDPGTYTAIIEDDDTILDLDFGNAADQIPQADGDDYEVTEDHLLAVPAAEGVLVNDHDADDDPLTAVLVNAPPYGTLLLNADGSFHYIPRGDFSGADSFTYRANDGIAESNLATVTITVQPVNDAPVAHDDSIWVVAETAREIASPGVLADDVDVEGDAMTATLVDPPAHATVSLQTDGSYTYVPANGYTGPDHFTYKAHDGVIGSNVATVRVTTVTAEAFHSLADFLRITELNYHPYSVTSEEAALGISDREAFEFIELRNTGHQLLDLAGLQMAGAVAFELDGPALLDPGGYTLLVKGRAAFEARYGGGLPVLGEYQGDLDNSAAQILLTDPFDQVIVDFRYEDRDDWPRWADGFGSTLEVLDVDGPYGDGGNWRASSQFGGSPGAASSPPPEIVVNELLTHANLPATDAIELLNRSEHAIDIGGWYLSDSANNLRKYRIPTGTVIPAGGYLVFDEHDFNPGRWDPGAGGFALDSALGEDVWLTAADEEGYLTWFVDHVEFGAALNGESFGRWPDGTGNLYPMTELTLPGQNSGPRVGPIIISEVMYNPPALNGGEPANLEFIEIYNPTNEVLDTPNWHVRGGVEYDFPTRYGFPVPADIPGRVTVDPGATVVLVGFDPADPADAETVADFRRYYSIDETVQLVGPLTGSLNNAGDVVGLLRPDHPPAWEPHHWPHVVEDELVYDDVTPWPTEPDGQGASLHRRRADFWGRDPASWVAGLPTPGSVDLRLGNLAISELNYNPYAPTDAELAVDPELDNDDFEFIELLNFAEETIDLDGVQLVDGVLFEFPALPLAPNQRIVVAKDLAAFQIRYGTDITVVGEYLGGLKNAGEHVMFASAAHGPIFDFTYADVDPWPVRADGNGSSLELVDPYGGEDDPANWRPSSEYGGSPGYASAGPIDTIVINEVLTRPSGSLTDTIELRNMGDHAVDIGGWYLSDSGKNPRKFSIPPETEMPGNGYLLFDETDFNPAEPRPAQVPFALDGTHGEEVFLLVADGSGRLTYFADHVRFGPAAGGESFGRWPGGCGPLYPMRSTSLPGPNSGPRVGPVLISEIMFHPREPREGVDPRDLEFVEIHNTSTTEVDLEGWQVGAGVGYTFPAGVRLGPHRTLVIASFAPDNPGDADRIERFRSTYGMNPSVLLLGGYDGRLSNRGEMVQLRRADGVLEDEVTYSDRAPWPVRPDGQGDSLHRLGTDLWGNDPAIWTTAAPTPGMAPLLAAPASGDLNGDGQVNGLDVDLLVGVLVGEPYNGAADMNQDGAVNGLDVDPFVTAIVGADRQPGVALGAASMSPTTERLPMRLLRARHVHDGDDHSQLIHHRRVEQVFARRAPLGRDGHRSPQEGIVHQVAGDWRATVERAFGDGADWLR